EELLLNLQPTDPLTMESQLDALLESFVQNAANCKLVLEESSSGVAQSFRNYRSAHNRPQQWAIRAMQSDSESLLGVRFLRTDDSRLRHGIAIWRTRQLRGKFDAETPWFVIADWHAENGAPHKAEFCRQLVS
ncbi:MAG: hypothetical protein AAGI63_15710, partial [Planctomycetota bacterium]